MTFIEILYYVTIKPLELFFEVVYMMAYWIIGSPSLAIIALSLAMNFLVLPLYRRADAMQEEERKIEERLGNGVRHIKQAFRGDERMMILQTYYRQNHYKQSYVLRGSLPLLLEIPFFIAAYRFLSGLGMLEGVSFGPIADLGAPDGLLVLGGLVINFLPILMTVINIISSSIYADHMSRKTRIQLYVMAAIFLVFLYDSPAGLVFYWTLNNLFSLVKNIFYKLPNPRRILRILATGIGLIATIYCVVIYQAPTLLSRSVLVGASAVLMMFSPVQVYLERRAARNAELSGAATGNGVGERQEKITTNSIFISAVVYLTILVGGLIPSAVIGSSPLDFVNLVQFYDPTIYVMAAMALAVGIFVVWCGLFYGLANIQYKGLMAWTMIMGAVIATMDYMIFKPADGSGSLSDTLVYDHGLLTNSRLAMMGLAACAAVCIIVYLTHRRLGWMWRSLLQIASIVITIMTVMNVVSTRKIIREFQSRDDYRQAQSEDHNTELALPLSTEGKNVVVIMLDRAIGSYVPYLFAEQPTLADAFDGFTYYPNTLSYGPKTNFAAPALFGGYEYTPAALNERDQDSLADKHDEALLTVPVLFSKEGYDVTVCDPPYAGYSDVSDLSIYDDYPSIRAQRLEGYISPDKKDKEASQVDVRKRNLFCYSVMRCAPLVIQNTLYNAGNYNAALSSIEYAANGAHQSTGYNSKYMDSYYVLESLSDITEVTDNQKGAYIFMDNNAVHEAALLQEPDYTPAAEIDNTEYDAEHADRFTIDGVTADVTTYDQLRHYETMMATLSQLSKWFDYLRENDLYDNTRIIIVSDHAHELESYEDRILEDGTDGMVFNPLLMVKDYDAHGFETSEEFMTNADVAYLSVDGTIENPINPFTGNAITNSAKHDLQYVLYSSEWNTSTNNGNQFLPGKWFSVHDDVRDAGNWKVVQEEAVLPY